MKRTVAYLAISLDGAIARGDGGLDWLDDASDFDFAGFLAGVDSIVLGRQTYEEILGFGPWPYGDRETWVCSRRLEGADERASFGSDLVAIVRTLVSRPGEGKVWLGGGGAIIAEALRHDLVDELELYVHPVLLGGGVPLVPFAVPDRHFALRENVAFPSGVVRLAYDRVREELVSPPA